MKSFKAFIKEYKNKLKEDILVTQECDGGEMCGSPVGSTDIVQGPDNSHGVISSDVLGLYDKDKGFFSKDDFYLPDMLFKYDRYAGVSSYKKKNKKHKHLKYDNLEEDELIQGLENMNMQDVYKEIYKFLDKRINDDYLDFEIDQIAIYGSRGRGTASNKSDLDIVVSYFGEEREDDAFNSLNREPKCKINKLVVDFNPIRPEETGRMEEFLKKSKDYDDYILKKQV